MTNNYLPKEERELLRQLRDAAAANQDGKCYWCMTHMITRKKSRRKNHPLVCTGDHLIRLADGGETTRENVVAAHKRCNNNRHKEGA